jgi:hypothetical protein
VSAPQKFECQIANIEFSPGAHVKGVIGDQNA